MKQKLVQDQDYNKALCDDLTAVMGREASFSERLALLDGVVTYWRRMPRGAPKRAEHEETGDQEWWHDC